MGAMKRVSAVWCILLIVGTGIAWYSQAAEVSQSPPKKEEKIAAEPQNKQKEKAAVQKSQPGKVATLTVKKGKGNIVRIDLVNSVPVRGVQFTITGIAMTEVKTTSRTTGFLAKFNEKAGIVIIVSTTGDEIAPGSGAIVEIVGERTPEAEIGLTNTMIVGKDKKLL